MIVLERRDGRPLRIGHRGAAALAPENTLRSFRAAVELGVDLVEFDVLERGDGKLVIAHSDDLAGLDAPTLDEALAYFAEEARSIGVHLDLKTSGTEVDVVAALRRFGLLERAFASSAHVRTVRALSAAGPLLRVGLTIPRSALGISETGRGAPIARAGLVALARVMPLVAAPALVLARASTLVLHHSLVDEPTVRRAHLRGAAVVAWTVDDLRDLARVDAAGADAVVSNDPRIFASLSTLET